MVLYWKHDCGMEDHPKLRKAYKDAGVGCLLLLCRSISWCKSHGTAGRFDAVMLDSWSLYLDDPRACVRALVRHRLWHEDGEHYEIHDYAEFQTMTQAERGRRGGRKSGRVRQQQGEQTGLPGIDDSSNEAACEAASSENAKPLREALSREEKRREEESRAANSEIRSKQPSDARGVTGAVVTACLQQLDELRRKHGLGGIRVSAPTNREPIAKLYRGRKRALGTLEHDAFVDFWSIALRFQESRYAGRKGEDVQRMFERSTRVAYLVKAKNREEAIEYGIQKGWIEE